MSEGEERFLLLADRGCPFAHRVRALFMHLGVEHDLIEAPPGDHPPELARWSPTHRIPLLVRPHGPHAIAIGESRVMLELLAETHSFAQAYPAGAFDRALHREVMAIVDEKLARGLFQEQPLPPARLAEYLNRLEHVARITPAAPCLLTFHVAPIWLRLQWWRPEGRVTTAIRERPALVAWLDGIAGLPAIVATSPPRAESIEDFNEVCARAALSALSLTRGERAT